jgi:LysR family transcriptional regulator, nitrogen assimilation regulatory protein
VSASLRDIRLFVATYEERSFTLAAQRENATQSGVSQHVKRLEVAFGVRLFLREPGGIVPTPAGEAYYRHCISALRAHAEAEAVLRHYAPGPEGQVLAGLMPTMTRCTLAPALARNIEAYPNVNVRVVEGYSGALTQMVRAGELDFAIVPAFGGGAGLKSRLFVRTPELLVSRPGADRAGGRPVRLAELGPLRLVLPGAGNTRRLTLETYCATVGAEIERIVELDAMLGTLDFVARTEFITILPAIMMGAGTAPGFAVNPIAEPPLWLDLVLIEPAARPLSPAASAFLALLREEAERLVAAWQPITGVDAPPRIK